MGYRTTTDETLDHLKEHTKNSIGDLMEIMNGDVNGGDQYPEEYLYEIYEALRNLKKKLNT